MAFTEATRWTVVEGPIKREVIIGSSDATDSFTVTTRIQNGQYVQITGIGDGTNSTTPAAAGADITAGISGRTVTITNPNASESYRISVEGF